MWFATLGIGIVVLSALVELVLLRLRARSSKAAPRQVTRPPATAATQAAAAPETGEPAPQTALESTESSGARLMDRIEKLEPPAAVAKPAPAPKQAPPPEPESPDPKKARQRREIVASLENLPTVPTVLVELDKLMALERTTAKELAAVIAQDPVLTAHVIKMANSSFYGRLQQRGSLVQGITTLGFRDLRTLICAVSVNALYKSFGSLEKVHRDHSVAVSIIAAALAGHFGLSGTEDMMLAGLLHDFGKIMLSSNNPEKYRRVCEKIMKNGMETRVAEEEVFGCDHAEVGAEIATKWRLPAVMGNVMRYHHDPGGVESGLGPLYDWVCLVNLSDYLAIVLGYSMVSLPEGFDLALVPAARRYELDHEDLEHLTAHLQEEVQEKWHIYT